MMGAASNVETVDSYLSLIDLINTKLEVFKQKYLALKAQAIEIFKQQLEEERAREQQDAAQPSPDSSESKQK